VCPTSVTVYTNGFSQSIPLTLTDTACVKILPGESGKLEVVAVVASQQYSIGQGVVAVWLAVTSSAAGSYSDVVLIPLK